MALPKIVAVPGIVSKTLEYLGINVERFLAFAAAKLNVIEAPAEWEIELRGWLDQNVTANLRPEVAVTWIAAIVAELRSGETSYNPDAPGLG